MTESSSSNAAWPILAVLATALLWGTFWLPARALQVGAPWATLYASSFTFFALVPLMVRRWSVIRELGAVDWFIGVMMAFSVAAFSEAFVHGEVAKVIVLFYGAPAWATVFERLIIGTPIGPKRLAAIGLGVLGVLIVFGLGDVMPVPSTSSDWMAIFSSVTWTLSLTLLKKRPVRKSVDRLLVVSPFLLPAFAFMMMLSAAPPAMVVWDLDFELAAWMLGFALIWLTLIVFGTVYAAARMSPGRVAILMMFEVVVGLVSAALLTQETIGARELIGAVLVMSAGVVELVRLTPSPNPIR